MIRCGEDPTLFNISSFEVKVMLHDWRRFATTFFSATGRSNIVATFFRMVAYCSNITSLCCC